VGWKHFAEMEDEAAMVRSGFNAADLVQGQLGDCWFVAALAVVAERPELIENVVVTKEKDPKGVYAIRLCMNRRWRTVLVDDRFPWWNSRFSSGGKPLRGPLYLQSSDPLEMWPALVEKA